MSRNQHEVYLDYEARGTKAPQTYQEARDLASFLMKDPAYSNPKHPLHTVVVNDVRELYQLTTEPDR